MEKGLDYSDDSIFPTRGLIPEVDAIRDRRIKEALNDTCIHCLSKTCVGNCRESNYTEMEY